MEIFYNICNRNIRISSPVLPGNPFLREFSSETACDCDINITVNTADVITYPDKNLRFNSNGIAVLPKGDILSRYAKMGTDEGSVTVYSNISARHSETSVIERNANVLLGDRYFWTTVAFPQLMLTENVLLFHASFIDYGGQGIIFTAPSGTGKSTQADLWKKYRNADIVNGDKTGVIVEENSVLASGVPFCGTSGICKNKTVPLKAVVLLRQAETNSVQRLSGALAVTELMKNIHLDFTAPDEQRKCVDLLIKLINSVPVLLLSCTPDEDAVKVLERELNI